MAIIQFDNLELPAQVESVQAIEGGYLVTGTQVALLHPFGYTRFYRHGFHSWSLTCWLDLAAPLAQPVIKAMWPHMDDMQLLAVYPFTGSGVGALQGMGEEILLLGALDLDAHVKADDQVLRGMRPAGECTWFLAYGDEQTVFGRYAARLAERYGRRGHDPIPRVWCSWYSLFREISEPAMLDILKGLAGLPFDVFQVDDGWQISIGDWDANPEFPSGMAALAGKIHQAGFSPGLWMAPLIVQPTSSIFREHQDWLLHDETGQPVPAGQNWGDTFYALDTTHPAVQDWLSQLIARVRSWGYEYLKLDFLYAAALPGVRHTNLPPEEAYREGMSVIRQAAEEAYILACGSPILPSLGLIEGARIGPDVAPFWDNPDRSQHLHDLTGPSTLNAIRTSIHRLWLRPLLHMDPDVAFFRTRYNLLTPEEQALLRNLALITGFRGTSDLPSWLDPEERQALQRFLETDAPVEQLGRYRFLVSGQEVDYGFVERV